MCDPNGGLVQSQRFVVEVGCDRSRREEAGLGGSVRPAGVGEWVRYE